MIESFLTLNMIELASWPCFSVPLLVFTLLSVHIYLLSSAEGHYNHFHSVRCCKNISQYVSPSYNQLLKCVKLSAFIMHSQKHECMYRGHAPVCVCAHSTLTCTHEWTCTNKGNCIMKCVLTPLYLPKAHVVDVSRQSDVFALQRLKCEASNYKRGRERKFTLLLLLWPERHILLPCDSCISCDACSIEALRA